jgi:hypothetical protein
VAQTIFSEALAPLAARLRERQPTIRLVSQVAFEMHGEHAFAGAIREIVTWMRNRSPSIPNAAFEGLSFRVAGGGAHPAEAVRIDSGKNKLWAAVLDFSDPTLARRTWVTELSVGQKDNNVAFGLRLLNITRGDDVPFEPSRPGVVRQILDEHIAFADGRRLNDSAELIENNEDDIDDFIELLSDPKRRLPVLAIAQKSAGIDAVNPDRLTHLVSGLAHVIILDEEAAWRLTRSLGKSLSVFQGAARLYHRGFNPGQSDPFDHPLWLPRNEGDPVATQARFKDIVARIFAQSIRSPSGIETFPRFEEIRQFAAENDREVARGQANKGSELLRLYEQDNSALREEMAAQKERSAEALDLTNSILEISERERDEARAELFALRSRVRTFEEAIKVRGVTVLDAPLNSFEDIDEWARKALVGNIWIAPKAIRESEKRGMFEDIHLFEKTLLLLRDFYVPMKRQPGQARYDAYSRQLQELGLEDQPCFSQNGAIERFPEYSVTYESKKYWCNDHIKYGSGYDPKRMFRIYYYWHAADEILLIGHMPTHLDNKLTS